MPKITLRNINKTYLKTIVAVDDVSMKIEDGEYVSLLGTSGSGKTTLLRIIAGFEKADSGEIFIDGREMSGVPPEKRNMGFVFQHFALFPHLSVWENVVYGPRIKGFQKNEVEKIGERVLKIVGLYSRKDSFPSELSGGMKQRVGLARALASGSKLLLMDEPLGSLDSRIKRDLKIKLRNWVKELGLTAIHVGHSQLEAMEISDKIFIMNGGKIVQSGSPAELYQNPKSIFIADFLGESNFLTAIVKHIDKKKTIVVVNKKLIFASRTVEFQLKEKVVVSFRPEDVKLMDKSNDPTIPHGKVLKKQFLQGKYIFTLKLTDNQLIKAQLVPSSHNAARKIGDELTIRVEERRVFIFPYPTHGLEKELQIL